MTSSVQLEVRPDGVAVLTLDQPGSRVNILTGQLWSDLETAIVSVSARADVKGLVIASGKPGVFIAGADLKLLGDAPGPNDPQVRSVIEHGLRVLEKLESLPFPTCAAIDGAALGGGLEVALACDCRILGTHPKVQLGLPEVNLGLIPGWGGTQRLPRIVGINRAADILRSGRILTGPEAASFSLTGVISEKPFEAAVESVSNPRLHEMYRKDRHQRLTTLTTAIQDTYFPVTGLTGAAAEAVHVMVEGASLALYEAIKLETETFMRLAGSPESKRLIAEFFASRKK